MTGIILHKTINNLFIVNVILFLCTITISLLLELNHWITLFITILIVNSIIYITAYGYQRRIKSFYIKGNINILLFLIHSNPRPKPNDLIDSINSSLFKIPESIKAKDENAHFILNGLNNTPYLYTLTKTIQDFERLRFSWIKALIEDCSEFKKSLIIGDLILYHNQNSILSRLVMYVTGCYWSHIATYIGEGKIAHTDLSGTVIENLDLWLNNPEVEVAVLRSIKPKLTSEEILERVKKVLGNKYSYKATLKTLWTIITFKKGTGLLDKEISKIVILLGFLGVFIAIINIPIISIIYFASIIIYLKAVMKHWIVYLPKFKTLIETSNEKS